MQRMDISWKMEKDHLEDKLKKKNVEVENLQQQLMEMRVQFTEIENRVEEIRSEGRGEVKKELEKFLSPAVEQGLRELPYEMVCADARISSEANSVITYDRITVEFNNSNQPGGADGTMNIETGVFTTVTSGYYIITYSCSIKVQPGEETEVYVWHNGRLVGESRSVTVMLVGDSGDFITEQASKTVTLHLEAGDTVDLRTYHNTDEMEVSYITLCLYMA